MRGVGNSVAMITNWVFVYVVVLITPTGTSPHPLHIPSSLHHQAIHPSTNPPSPAAISNIAWRFYIIFAVLNFAWFPIIWFFYVETKGLSLEEVDLMFKIKYHGKKEGVTYKEAARRAKAETERIRERERQVKDNGVLEEKEKGEGDGDGDKGRVEMKEFAEESEKSSDTV
jgi:hypothetical protein